MKKRVLAVLLTLSMCFGISSLSFENEALAKDNKTFSISGESYVFKGLLEEPEDEVTYSFKRNYGALNKADWEGFFDNKFYYNNMNTNQKNFYDALMAATEDFFYNEKDAIPIEAESSGSGNRIVENVITKDGIRFEGMSADEAGSIYTIFQNSNPKFYFLDNSRIFTQRGNGGSFYPAVYSQYKLGSDRSASNKKYLEIVNSYVNEVKSVGTNKADRQKKIHSLLAEKLTYASNDQLEWPPHQSTATAVFDGVTVCAGYSELYALLCNAVGIPCICVTSTSHEWNMVQYGNYWYNVDLTNDDGGITPRWKYYNVPNSPSFDAGHTPEPIYVSLKLPKGEYNFGDKPLDVSSGTVYRLYNKNNGEHFFTKSSSEKNSLVRDGWDYEGIAFVSETSDKSVPVYRLYNPNSGEHYYTINAGERNRLVISGWNYEKVAFYSNPQKKKPVYMLFDPNSRNAGSHHYTKSYGEATLLVIKGWEYQKIGWYACE